MSPMWLKKKLIDPFMIEDWAAELRKARFTIATLNGSFDLLHPGHLSIVYAASEQADKLIVALNSDESIKKNKGEARPILSLPFRLQMIAALEFVDFVTWFDEVDPRNFLNKVKPDVHVNSIEYGENSIEAHTVISNGGKIYIVDKIEGLSTTHLIDRIQCV